MSVELMHLKKLFKKAEGNLDALAQHCAVSGADDLEKKVQAIGKELAALGDKISVTLSS